MEDKGIVMLAARAIELYQASTTSSLRQNVSVEASETKVFVLSESKMGICMCTDGKSWDDGIVSGQFLIYHERKGNRSPGTAPISGRGSDKNHKNGDPEPCNHRANGPGSQDLHRPNTDPMISHITPPKGMYLQSSLINSNPMPALAEGTREQSSPQLMVPQAPHLQGAHQNPDNTSHQCIAVDNIRFSAETDRTPASSLPATQIVTTQSSVLSRMPFNMNINAEKIRTVESFRSERLSTSY